MAELQSHIAKETFGQTSALNERLSVKKDESLVSATFGQSESASPCNTGL